MQSFAVDSSGSHMKILVAAFGSYGDLFPHIGLARGLQERGHQIVFASHAKYRDLVSSASLNFVELRPDLPSDSYHAQIVKKAATESATHLGSLFTRFYIPHLQETFDDLQNVARDCDGMISICNLLAAPFVARKLNKPWISTALCPLMFGSSKDFSIFPSTPKLFIWLKSHKKSGRFFVSIARKRVSFWMRSYNRFGCKIGMPVRGHPMYEWLFSPRGNLGLFPHCLIPDPPSDWPVNTVVTGFIPWQGSEHVSLSSELTRFLAAGAPPVVFSLGTWAVNSGKFFYQESAEACLKLGQRGVFLVGNDKTIREAIPQSPLLFVADYEPHAALFKHACAVVNHGGVGSFTQALLAEKPMIVVPFGLDQFDNAYRLRTHNLAKYILLKNFTAEHCANTLWYMLADQNLLKNIKQAKNNLMAHDGVTCAVDTVERMFARKMERL